MFLGKRSLSCLFGLVSLAMAADAVELVTFHFGGYLSEVDASLAGVFEVGDPFYGSVTFDLDAPDQLPQNTTYGIYQNVVAFHCSINGTHQAAATEGHANLPAGVVLDWLIDGGFSGELAAGMAPQFVNIPMYENSSNPILTTDAMPGDPFPSMLDFGHAEFRIRYGSIWNENEVKGAITLDNDPLPVDDSSWGRIKAQF